MLERLRSCSELGSVALDLDPGLDPVLGRCRSRPCAGSNADRSTMGGCAPVGRRPGAPTRPLIALPPTHMRGTVGDRLKIHRRPARSGRYAGAASAAQRPRRPARRVTQGVARRGARRDCARGRVDLVQQGDLDREHLDEGQLCRERRASRPGLDAQRPVERLDPVGQTAQAGAEGSVRAAMPLSAISIVA